MSLVFGAAGTGGATLTDNLTTGTGSWTVAGITFNSGAVAFVINPLSSSNGFKLTTGITNNSTSLETINDKIATNGSVTFTMTAGGGNITLGGNVTGSNFATAGAGTLTLGGADAFTTTLTIGAGTTLAITGTGSLTNAGTGRGVTFGTYSHNINLAVGGTLSYSSSVTQTLSGLISNGSGGAGGALVVSGNGTLTLSDGADTYGNLSVLAGTVIDTANPGAANPATELGSGTITIGSGSLNANATLNLNLTGPGGNGPFPGNAYGTIYSNAISVNGTGVNTLEETNYNAEFTGAVTLNSSNLTVIDNNTGGTEMLFSGGVTGTGNVVLQLNNIDSEPNLIEIGTGGINNNGTITNSGVAAGGLSLTNNDTQITGVIGSNVTGVIENSAGTALILSGADTYTGDTTVASGELVLSENSGTSSTAAQDSVVNLNGGTLAFGSSTTSATIGGLGGSGALNLENTSSAAVNLTLGNSNVSNGSGTNPNTLNPTYSGDLSNSAGTASVTMVGTNIQIFSGVNTYNGGTTISQGTLEFENTTAMPATGVVSVGSGATLGIGVGSTGALFTAGTSGNGTVGGIFSGLGGQSGGTVTLNSGALVGIDTTNAGGAFTYSGNITNSGVGLTKLGTGTLTLSGLGNTYTGPTLVSAGTLNIVGVLGSSAVTVASGAVLTGSGDNSTAGIVGGLTTVNGGGEISLAGANPSQILTLNGLTLGASGSYAAGSYATLDFTFGSSGAGLIDVGTAGSSDGTLTLNSSGAYIDISGIPTLGSTTTLMNFGSQILSGSFSLSPTTPGVTTLANGSDTYTLTDTGTELTLTYTGNVTPGVTYFTGKISSIWDDSSAAPSTNWSSNLSGTTDAGNIPGAITDVILNASNKTGAVTTTLGANTIINSLNINSNASGATVVGNPGDATTLQINALADSNTDVGNNYTGNTAGTGIQIAPGAGPVTINVPLILGASGNQSWTNGSSNPFTVTGSVTGLAAYSPQTLTLGNTSTGGMTISGPIGNGSGTVGVTVDNTGSGAGLTTTLSGNDTYSGPTTITAGTLQISGAGSLGGGSYGGAITDNGTLIFASSVAQTLSGAINGSGTIVEDNANSQLTLSDGADTYGNLSVLAGTVIDTANPGAADPATELGSGTITIGSSSLNATATLNLDLTGPGGDGPFPGDAYGTIYSNAISVNGTGVNTLEETNYNAEFTGAVTLNSSNLTVIDNNGNGTEMLFTGGITGTGNIVLQLNNINSEANLIQIGTGGINNNGTITNSGVAAAGLSATNNYTQITGVIGTNVTGVIENSAGTALILSGADTYTGDTTVTSGELVLSENSGIASLAAQDSVVKLNGGTLAFGSSTTSATIGGLGGSRALNLVNTSGDAVNLTLGNSNVSNGSLTNPNTLNPTYSGNLSNSVETASVTKAGTNTQILSGSNTYNGGTTISAGTLEFTNTTSMPATGTVTVSSGATLGIGVGSTDALFTSGTSGNGTVGGIFSGLGGQSGGTVTLNSGASVGIDTTLASGAFTYSGNITNSGIGLTKLGTGTLTLSGLGNTYTGPTLVRAGTLNITGVLGSSAVTVASGAVLTGSGNNSTAGIVGGLTTVNGGGEINLASASPSQILTLNGLTLGASSSYAAGNYATLDFTFGSSGAGLIDVGTAGSSDGTLMLNSSGAYIDISGIQTLGSTITLMNFGSQVLLGSFSLSPTTPGVTTLAIGSDTYTLTDTGTKLTLTYTGNPTPGVAYFTGKISSIWDDSSAAPSTNWSGNLSGTTDAGNIPGAITDVILNASNKTGAVTTTLGTSTIINSLNVNSNASGATVIGNPGDTTTLQINALADTNTDVGNNYTGNTAGTGIQIAPGAGSVTINVPLILGAGASGNQNWTNGSSNTFTVTGTVTGLAAYSPQTLTLSNTSTGGTTISGAIGDGSGTVGVIVDNTGSGAGLTTLSGINTYTGGTTISQGTLEFANTTAMPATGTVTVGSGATLGIGVGAGTYFTAGTSGNGTVGGIFSGLGGQSGSTVTLNSGASVGIDTTNATGGFTYSGNITNSGIGLTKLGTGMLTLSGLGNTYTGPTLVSAGTLNITGVLGSSAVTVASGAVLTGSGDNSTVGIVGGLTTVNGGGAISLGGANPSQILTLNGLTLGTSGSYAAGNYVTLDFAFGSSGAGLIDVGTAGSSDGTLTLNSSGAYIDISGLPALSSTTTLINFGSLVGSGSFSLSPTTVTNTLTTGFNTYTLAESGSQLTLTYMGNPTPGVAYFTGKISTVWNDASGAPSSNWSSNLSGATDAGNIPAATTDVILNASNKTGAVTTTLGANTIINSLNINSNASGATVIGNPGDTTTLQINALADTNTDGTNYTGNTAGTGIRIAPGAGPVTINVPLILGANGGAPVSQTWTNGSTNPFTVTGSVTGLATFSSPQTLTLSNTSTGGTTISGPIGNGSAGGTVGVTVDNTGSGAGLTTTLSGIETYTGPTTVTAGALQINGAGSLGGGSYAGAITDNGTLIFASSAAQSLSGAIGGSGTIVEDSANSPLTLSGSNTFAALTILSGTVNLDAVTYVPAPTAAITLGNSANTGLAATLVQTNGNNANNYTQTYSGPITVTGNGIDTIAVTDYNPVFSGPVTLSDNLNVITDNPLGSPLVLSGSIGGTGNLNLRSNYVNPSGLGSQITLSGTINNAGTITNSGLGSGTVNTTISGLIGRNVTGVIENSAGSALILGNAGNTYTAPTTIIEGSLMATTAGAITSSTEIDVRTSGTLDISQAVIYNQPGTQTIMGAGTINAGATSFNIAGTIQPHDSVTQIGTLSVNDNEDDAYGIYIGNHSNFILNIGATTGDQFAANGSVNLGVLSTDTINLTINLTAQPVNGTMYAILTAGNSELTNTGLFSYGGNALANDALFVVQNNGHLEQFEVTYGTTSDELIAEQAIPEPGAWGMALSGASLLIFARQMRRRTRK